MEGTRPTSRRKGVVSLASAMVINLAVGAVMLPSPALGQNQPLPAEDRAALVLNAGRLAFNQRNYPVAAERFRAFLREFSGDRRVASARFGLGLALLESPEKDFNAAVEALSAAVNQLEASDRPQGYYYLGAAYRAQGTQIVEKAGANVEQRNQANWRFENAAKHFAQAGAAFAALVKTPPPADAKELPVELEWVARAKCDQAEMLLRLNRPKEVLALLAPWSKEPTFVKSRYRPQATYLLGYAAFAQKDYVSAGRMLSQLAPFTDPAMGVHARFLLARTHHLAEERPEAIAAYEAVVAGFEKEKKAAAEALKNPAAFKDKPEEKARLEALVRDAAPDYVGRSMFYRGVLLFEQGKFADALPQFAACQQQFPKSSLAAEAQLRVGMTHVQMRQIPEATRNLQPLADHPQIGDQALLWLAKAQLASADPANPQAVQQQAKQAIEILRRAYDKVKQIIATDPAVRVRKGEVLMELAEMQQVAKLPAEAMASYQKILSDGSQYAEWQEPALHRMAVSQQLAGQYAQSDQTLGQFISRYPKSPSLPEALFRHAENAFLMAANHPSVQTSAGPNDEAKRFYVQAIDRYKQAIDKCADTPYAGLARQGLGTAYCQLGQYEEAAKVLKSIPDAERNGELASVSYLLADCLLRTLPEAADDALTTAQLISQLNEAGAALNAYVSVQEQSPQAPDATLKLGYCHQRVAALMADPAEKRNALAKARLAYAMFMQKYPKHPLFGQAAFEHARCLAQLGDVPTAINELSRFQRDPLRNSPVAPLALIRMADYMRLTRRAPEAVKVLTDVRSQHEASLQQDKSRAAWVPMLQYNLALALKDAGKASEARALFESIMKQFADRPEATESIWRFGQSRKDEALEKVDAARKALAQAGSKPEALAKAQAALDAAAAGLRECAAFFQKQADQLAGKPQGAAVRVRMLYEAAWCSRALAEVEVDAAREKLQAQALKKFQEKLAQQPNAPQMTLRAPEIPASAIPLQPAEQQLREQYKAIIANAGDSPLANDARFELADLLIKREEYEPAAALLKEALELDPPADLMDKVRLRLGACYLAKNDFKNALPQFNAILQVPKSPLAPHARYGVAECLLLQLDWAGAIQHLAAFRDNDVMRSIPGTSDRALLRLGHAYAQTGQWEPSRVALEALIQRFPASPWALEARYALAQARQNQQRFDEAVAAYTEVTQRTTTELAAKAQLQIGLCRLTQKRPKDALAALLAVPYTYDYPELGAAALFEASRAHIELNQKPEAQALLQRVVNEYPATPWVEPAKKRLAELK